MNETKMDYDLRWRAARVGSFLFFLALLMIWSQAFPFFPSELDVKTEKNGHMQLDRRLSRKLREVK